MKPYVYLYLLVLIPTVCFGMSNQQIKLTFDDGTEVIIDKKTAEQSIMLKTMLIDLIDPASQEDIVIPLPPIITSQDWIDVIGLALQQLATNASADLTDFVTTKTSPIDKNPAALLAWYTKIINAANFLDIKPLLTVTTKLYALYFKNNPSLILFESQLLFNYINALPHEMQNMVASHPDLASIAFAVQARIAQSGQSQTLTWVDSLAFNHSGAILASVANYKAIKLWDVQNPRKPQLLATIDQSRHGHRDLINEIIFNPSGIILASGSLDKTVKLWNLQNPQQPKLITTIDQQAMVYSLALDPSGTILACGLSKNMIKLWDIGNPQQPQLIATINPSKDTHISVNSLAFNPSVTVLASGPNNQTIELWNIRNPKNPQLLATVAEGELASRSVIFNPLGTVLASAAEASGSMRLWGVEDPQQPQLFATINNQSFNGPLAFNFSGTIFASASNSTIKLWDIRTPKHPQLLAEIDHPHHLSKYGPKAGVLVRSVAFNPAGTILASGLSDGTIFLWKIIDYREYTLLQRLLLYGLQNYNRKTGRKFEIKATDQRLLDIIDSSSPDCKTLLQQQATIVPQTAVATPKKQRTDFSRE